VSWRALTVPAALVVAAIIVSGLYDTYRYFALHSEIASIDREQQKIIKDVFPELGYVEPNQERFMMEQALSRMNGAPQSASAQSMLAETATVLRRQNVTLANIVYRDSELIITCQLSDFSQVDLLTNQLNARPRINARLQSSAADDGEIIASYRLTAS
jgi:type II secretory pathway component PulL